MQQAYQALRVISEAQTVHIVLATLPGELMLTELRAASEALQEKGSDGIKAVILDFADPTLPRDAPLSEVSEALAHARAAVYAIPQPVLAVARTSLSEVACTFLTTADFTLIAHEAEICLAESRVGGDQRITGLVAARLGYATWSAPAVGLDQEMARVLGMLRSKSALALRQAKASARLGSAPDTTRATATATASHLEALQRINQFYLEKVVTTQDAREGPQAFLEKRVPRWQNQ